MNTSGKNAVKFDLTASTKAARLSRRNEQMIDPFRTSGSSPNRSAVRRNGANKTAGIDPQEMPMHDLVGEPVIGGAVQFEVRPLRVVVGKRMQAMNAVMQTETGGAR